MARSRPPHDRAKAPASPFFAWTNVVLNGSETMQDSLQAAARNARTVRVGVLPEVDELPGPGPAEVEPQGAKRGAKKRRG